MANFYAEPVLTLLSRPSFTTPEHLPVNWIGDSTDGERLAEFAGRLCYMSQHNPAKRNTREYLENIKKQGHGSVLEHANYSVLLEGVSRSLTHELVRRAREGAELEIRRLAVTLLRMLQREAPGFFSDFEIYQGEDRREAARISYHKV